MYEFILTVIAILISALMTPFVKKVAIKINAIDVPTEERRVHKKPTPLLGGISIYISFIIVTVLKRGTLTNYEIGILLGASVIVIGGCLDDKYNLKPYQKLLFQVTGGVILICFGVMISVITNPFSSIVPYLNLKYIAYPLTFLLITAKIVSYIGSPNVNIGTAIANAVADFMVPSMEIAASKKPKSCEPVSPIKIDAGLKL